jgi:hypothetical protein
MNRLNAEMCKAPGISYRAPWVFENPLKEEGKKEAKQAWPALALYPEIICI